MVLRVPVPGTPWADNISFYGDDNFAYHIASGGGADSIQGGELSDLLEGGTGDDNLFGSGGNDVLYGQDGRDTLIGGAGDDYMHGGASADRLAGGGGKDTMTGGSGSDVFVYAGTVQSPTGASFRDVITDFAQGADIVSLDAIDARTGVAGDQDFAFIGTGAFTGAGQVRYVQSGGNTLVRVETNGDGVTDMEIELTGLYTLTASDFDL